VQEGHFESTRLMKRCKLLHLGYGWGNGCLSVGSGLEEVGGVSRRGWGLAD
jgi:hypothetical protein